jgi:uncharacterized protein YndB with AHSA1/START domain
MKTQSETGVTRFETPSDREVAIVRVFEAPRELVFDAWTDPAHLREWMLGPPGWTMPICERDLRAGGVHRTVWRKGDGEEMEIRGIIKEVVRPERLVSTETWGADWPETVNTLVFTEQQGLTTVTLTVLYPSKEARDAALQTGMKEGMDQGFARLDEFLHERRRS